MLAEYQDAAAAAKSAAFAYLADLIVDDEIRHHKICGDLAAALKTDAELRPEQPVIPRLDVAQGDPQKVIELSGTARKRARRRQGSSTSWQER